MEYSRAAAGQMQLDDYVGVVPQIYSAHDAERSIWDVWCHTLHHTAAVAEAIRKGAPADELFKEIADFALWLLTTVDKLTGRIGTLKNSNETPVETIIRIQSSCSDLVWHKYPHMCPLCYSRRTKGDRNRESSEDFRAPCDCLTQVDGLDDEARRRAIIALRSFSEDNRSKKPQSIDEWQKMFGQIFGANLRRLSLTDIALHLMEELGEASDAMIRMYSYTDKKWLAEEARWRQLRLEAQLADVFSWLFALVEKINSTAERAASKAPEPILLSQIIWRRYGSDDLRSFFCPHCGKPVCSCPVILVPAARSLEELKSLFQEPDSQAQKA